MTSESRATHSRLLLDTTLQVDRVKSADRLKYISSLTSGYDFAVSTGISLLEFKAVVIQECITIHNALRRSGARFTAVRDQLLESNHRQQKLRAHIFNNYLQVFQASSFEITESLDQTHAEGARILLAIHIPRLYTNFRRAVDFVIDEPVRCNRANEPPELKRAAFATNLPKCRRGVNKTCKVEDLAREHIGMLDEVLRSVEEPSEQLCRAAELVRSLKDNPTADWSHDQCRRAGDCLIAMEAQKHATHAASTNVAEWGPLSHVFGFEFVHVRYPNLR